MDFPQGISDKAKDFSDGLEKNCFLLMAEELITSGRRCALLGIRIK